LSLASARQLAFGFAAGASMARADFIAADSNRLALAWIGRPADWPAGRLVLSGPPGSGKSHLSAIFAQAFAAPILPARRLGEGALPELLPAHGSAVVEGADQAPERPLLHLLNLAAEAGGRVLLTARLPASVWHVALPDLRSRLGASGQASLGIPDQALVRAVLAKCAADRQLRLSQPVLDWLAARLPRDLAAAERAIALLDAAALAHGRAADLRLARLVLSPADEFTMTRPDDPSPQAGPLL
jgi:chromosomal replication initiation ATPase DnaA